MGLIKEVYIDGTLTVEGASIKYLHCSKSLAYKEVIEPFFSGLEKKIYELSVNTKININLEKVKIQSKLWKNLKIRLVKLYHRVKPKRGLLIENWLRISLIWTRALDF